MPAEVENRGDFADSDRRQLRILEEIQQCLRGWRDGEILPVSSACEASRPADKGPRNDACHTVRTVEQFPGNFAYSIELRERNNLFVRRHLEYGISRGVYDRLPRPHMFRAQLLDDFRARGRPVSQHIPPDGAS